MSMLTPSTGVDIFFQNCQIKQNSITTTTTTTTTIHLLTPVRGMGLPCISEPEAHV